jgi:hypothetical protein
MFGRLLATDPEVHMFGRLRATDPDTGLHTDTDLAAMCEGAHAVHPTSLTEQGWVWFAFWLLVRLQDREVLTLWAAFLLAPLSRRSTFS